MLENFAGPKSSVIFGNLSGGPLEQTGVMSGMSGSPVYIDGRLVGAVAFMFPFSKEPLAGNSADRRNGRGLRGGGSKRL